MNTNINRKEICHEKVIKRKRQNRIPTKLRIKGSYEERRSLKPRIIKALELFNKIGIYLDLSSTTFYSVPKSSAKENLGNTNYLPVVKPVTRRYKDMKMADNSVRTIIEISIVNFLSEENISQFKKDYHITSEITEEDAMIIVIVHELVHLYDLQLKMEVNDIFSWRTEGNDKSMILRLNDGVSQFIIPKVLLDEGLSVSDVSNELNGYPKQEATRKDEIVPEIFNKETFAEALTEFMTSSNPRRFAKLVFEELERFKKENAIE